MGGADTTFMRRHRDPRQANLTRGILLIAAVIASTLQVGIPPASAVEAATGPTSVGGVIATDTTWDRSGSPYLVTSNITIAQSATLRIEPGTVVKLGGTEILVDGQLLAQGSAADPVVFTSSRDDSAGGDTNGDGTATVPAGGN